jgi:hypothetical protein
METTRQMTETTNLDRLGDLVTELLEAGEDPQKILDTVKDTIRDWRYHKKKEPSV